MTLAGKWIYAYKYLTLKVPKDCHGDLDLRAFRQERRDMLNPFNWLRSQSWHDARQNIAASFGIADEVERASFIRDQIINLASDHKISRTVAARLMKDAERSVKDHGLIVWANQVINHYRHCGQTWTDDSDISACPNCLIVTRPTHSKKEQS